MAKPFKTLDDMGEITGKVVLVREDLNVPMQDGSVTDDTRLRAAMPTVLELADRGAKVLILAHFGRPKGQKNPEYSLSKITRPLTQVLGREVQFIPDCQGEAAIDGIKVMRNGDIAILENTRFHAGEEKNDPALIDAIAAIGDLYVNDAFRPPIAPMRPPKVWRTSYPPLPGGRWRKSWMRCRRRSVSRSSRLRRSSAAQRCRPSWTCSTIWSQRSII